MKNSNLKERLASTVLLITILFQLFRFPILRVQALEHENSEKNQNIDVRLQDDFYTAVNKEWIENTKLENGYVSYPNVNTVTEMTNLIDSTRAYEANATAFEASKSMAQTGLSIGQ